MVSIIHRNLIGLQVCSDHTINHVGLQVCSDYTLSLCCDIKTAMLSIIIRLVEE